MCYPVLRGREPVSGLTHAAGAVLALGGMVWLVHLTRHDIPKMLTVIVFGASMIVLYTASAVLHLYRGSKQMIRRLNQFDHAAIYVMIAGTYTPFLYILLAGGWRWGTLVAIWAVAIIGAAIKLVYFWQGHVSTMLYVSMGWLGVIVAPRILPVLEMPALWLLAGGGVIYMVGALIFALRRPNFHPRFGFHELWHVLVLAGSALHFAALRVILL